MTEEEFKEAQQKMVDLSQKINLPVNETRIKNCSNVFELSLALELLYRDGNWRWGDNQRYAMWDLEKEFASKDERAKQVSDKSLAT